jgi:hypothetical protein
MRILVHHGPLFLLSVSSLAALGNAAVVNELNKRVVDTTVSSFRMLSPPLPNKGAVGGSTEEIMK